MKRQQTKKKQTRKQKVQEIRGEFRIMGQFRYSIDGVYVGKSVEAGGGRGVFAARDFAEGEVVELSPCIRVCKNPSLLEYTNLCDYLFSNQNRDSDDNAYVGLGYTSLYNHKEIPNATFDVMDNIIGIIAVKPIQAGEEIFVNYGWDTDRLDFKRG